MIIKGPYITEKTQLEAEKNRYSFWVAKDATKPEIKKEIERLYNVNVEHVTIINIKGKKKNIRRKSGIYPYFTKAYKKAVVTLKKNQKIDIFSKE